MTSQPQPPPVGDRPVGTFLRPLRDLAALALVIAPAVMLFVAVIRLIPSGDGLDFSSRTQDSFYSFVNLATITFPLAAVLLALAVRPQHPRAKLITMLALGEYAVAAFFALVFGVLVGLIQILDFSVRTAFEELLVRAAWLAVFAVAAYATFLVWRNLYYVPKPKPQPGMYGQPQYGVPGTYPGQPGYGQPGGYPPGQPVPGQPAGWGAPPPGYGPPPAGAPGWGQPPVSGQPAGPPPGGAPASAPPAGAHAAPPPGPYPPGPPAGTYGAPPPGHYSEPTQVVPRADGGSPDAERTTMLPEDRPGYGPADQDPPRR